MNRVFYLSGLQVLIAIVLIFLLLPTIMVYIVFPLVLLGLAFALFRWGKSWFKPKVYRYGAGPGPVIDVQAERE
jgi:hypothetical protein